MAGGFDKFVSSVNRGITTINVKTSSSLEKSKIKTHIDTLNSDIAKLYSLTGEMMYYKWKNNRDDLSDVYEKFEAIKAKFEEIEKLNQEMAEIDEKSNDILVGENVLQAGAQPAPSQQPPVVQNAAPQAAPVQPPVAPPIPQPMAQPVEAPPAPAVTVPPEAPVAPPTSVAQPVVSTPPAAAGIVCPNCGSEYKDTVKFCRKCGTKLQ